MYRLKLHKNLNKERWGTFDRGKQLLMIANELNRAKNWINKEDFEEVRHCYERAFELLDLTVSITENGNMLRELLRFREMLAYQYINIEKNTDFNNKLIDVLLSLDKEAYKVKQMKNN